jgi:hypothetical protein
MLATYVDPKLTPMAFEEAEAAMRAALGGMLSTRPRDEVLSLALAKSALETGRWKAIWNDNWGNVKAGSTYGGMFTCITLNEVLSGKVVWFAPEGQLAGGRGSAVVGQRYDVPPGHPQTRMRAYANHYDGAYAYVDFVSGKQRYAASWQALLAGDPVGYVRELKKAGYFTADEEPYRKAVVSLHKEFLAKVRNKPREPEDEPDWDALRAIVATQQIDIVGTLHADAMREMAGLPTQPPDAEDEV